MFLYNPELLLILLDFRNEVGFSLIYFEKEKRV
jgi:hypothetical protein